MTILSLQIACKPFSIPSRSYVSKSGYSANPHFLQSTNLQRFQGGYCIKDYADEHHDTSIFLSCVFQKSRACSHAQLQKALIMLPECKLNKEILKRFSLSKRKD